MSMDPKKVISIEVHLGKIQAVHYGFGDYQNAMFGISFTLEGKDWGIGDFWGFWPDKWTINCKWSQRDQLDLFGRISIRIAELLREVKCHDISKLVGIPVEVTTKGGVLESWRILNEVL